MKVRILHCADLHVGSPFHELFDHVPQEIAKEVQHASEGVLGRIVDLAILHHVDVVTIGGDLFDEPDPPVSTQYEVTRQFKRLAQAGIPLVLCHGNHDPLVKTPLFPWPESVHVLGVSGNGLCVTDVILTIRGVRVQFAGFSFLSSELYGSQVHQYRRRGDADVAVALYHGQVGPSGGRHQAYAATSLHDMTDRSDFDVWALGHLHQFHVLHESHPLVFYPGTPQGRDVSETGWHGVVILELDTQGNVQYEKYSTATVAWQSVHLDVTEKDDFDSIWSAIRQMVERNPEVHRQLLHMHLYGQTALHEELGSETAREVFQSAADHDGEALWIYRFTQACMPELDFDVWRNSDGYIAQLLQLLEEAEEGTLDIAQLLRSELSDDEWAVVQGAVGEPIETTESILAQARQMLLGGIGTTGPGGLIK